MSDQPKKDFDAPTKIVGVFFHGDVSLGYQNFQSANLIKGGSGEVDEIRVVTAGEYMLPGGAKIQVADGVLLMRLQVDRNRPGNPKTLRVGFTPWANVKSVLYG